MKNITTPRTLAECNFSIGYPTVALPNRRERVAGVVLAVVIGILCAAGLVHWWSA